MDGAALEQAGAVSGGWGVFGGEAFVFGSEAVAGEDVSEGLYGNGAALELVGAVFWSGGVEGGDGDGVAGAPVIPGECWPVLGVGFVGCCGEWVGGGCVEAGLGVADQSEAAGSDLVWAVAGGVVALEPVEGSWA